MTNKEDSFTSADNTTKCEVTNKTIIDDCHISIAFGYGSDLDMTTYTFSPVSENVGKLILEMIKAIGKEGFDIEDFGVDELAEGERKWAEEWDNYTDEEREQKKKEWGII